PASQAPDNRYGADLDAMLASITPKTRVIFLANPNNPTGTWVKRDALKAFLDQVPAHVWVVLDEAYFEYVDDPEYPDGLALLSDYPNLLVTRTFSKIHGLAALRLGFGVSHPELADLLNRVRQPFNVNAIAMAAALAALQDQEFISESQQLNAAGLRQMRTALETMGYDCIPSVGNFISFDCGVPGGTLFQALLQEGVIVRPIAEYGLPNHIRVSIGLPAENQRFIDALQTVRTTLASTQADAQHSAQQ
ncbi:MAG TPA: histidinol-phosphate transaminase, partial [Gammaproteobacteria bacterium]|nr:histidinol-phosphate transaminase [Gammaproteobacteria bacterium]